VGGGGGGGGGEHLWVALVAVMVVAARYGGGDKQNHLGSRVDNHQRFLRRVGFPDRLQQRLVRRGPLRLHTRVRLRAPVW
jgi:hypothetical protein